MKLIDKIFIFSLILIILISTNKTVYSSNINELNKQKSEIQNKTSELKEQLSEIKEEKNDIQNQIESLDQELVTVQNEIEALNTQLNLTKEKLQDTEQELQEATEFKEKQYESLKNRMRFMYQYGNTGYIEFILGAQKLTDFFKRVKYINSIIEYDKSILERYTKTEETISQKVAEIKIQQNNIEILTEEQRKREQALNNNIAEKENLLKSISSEESTYLEQISDLEKESKEITNLIKQAQLKSITSTGESNNKIYTTSGGKLEYPVPAYRGYKYNSPYGNRINPISKKSEFHTGVDLKATLGTDIVSAEDGIVIFAGNRGGYGKTVVVDHGNNLTTLYAHNSSITVSVGQTVKRGQVIAKAGTTGYSTGVHLHFEVRIDGNHVNPQPYIGN